MRVYHEFSIESARRLPNLPASHVCSRLHGNTFRIRVGIEGDVVPGSGWVMDFADLAAAVRPVLNEIDHCLLNDVAGLENPTTELLAVWIWERLAPGLPDLAEIAIWENDRTGCVYQGA